MITQGILEEVVQEEREVRVTEHIPAMVKEVCEYLRPNPGDVFIDCTLGLGGHAQTILERIGPQGKFIGIDRDQESLAMAQKKLQSFSPQCSFIHDDFRNLLEALHRINVKQVNGILFDLGVSSFQLENAHRGFSFVHEGPLDMRMDQNFPIDAYDLINSLSENELSNILNGFGQERWSKRIARWIVRERLKAPIQTTKELAQIVLRAVPLKRARERIHPATRTFQAFRIAVNRELESLTAALDQAIFLLGKGGRMGIISFHSLEDKIVKEKFKTFDRNQMGKILLKKPLRPTLEEIAQNPRARSARLRVIERI